ncbi:MliC family protein [Sphingomonas sp. BT-65]|uniref:MliC family protein n=1 Tax=Sphingomonas sp. BT-65 TaxID=2989821 RepID=UPI0022354A95|nr:MliC family protein [Sphingomonas sp. BT-65]MCW4460345.1 MliC family protein [Sphingomonas sp. BT-65]
MGLALLAGCGQQPATPANGTTENTTAVNETAAAPTAAAPQTVAYDCMPALLLSATYDNATTPAKARLTIGDQSYDLTGVQAASGAKYATDQGRSAGKTLVWWTKGEEGTLFEGKVGGTEADEKKVSSCSPRRG